MKSPYDIVNTLIVTEKNTALKDQKKYVFKVNPASSKIEIASAVEKLFGVKVKSVNVVNCLGKVKRSGRSPKAGRRPDWKKAVVTLSEGAIEIV